MSISTTSKVISTLIVQWKMGREWSYFTRDQI